MVRVVIGGIRAIVTSAVVIAISVGTAGLDLARGTATAGSGVGVGFGAGARVGGVVGGHFEFGWM